MSPPPAKKGGCLKVGLIILGVLVGLVILIAIIGVIAGGGDKNTGSGSASTTASTAAPAPGEKKAATPAPFTDAAAEAGREDQTANSGALFPGRTDAQEKDRESAVPGAIRMEGRTVIVTSAGFVQTISQFETNGYLKVSITMVNRDKSAQAYNPFDFKLQTPAGTVVDPGFTTAQTLSSGSLVTGGTVSGDIVFDVGAQKGDYYLIYKPDPFDATRGIWKITV